MPSAGTPYFSEMEVADFSAASPFRSESTGVPPAPAMDSACMTPRRPAPPVMTITRSFRSKRERLLLFTQEFLIKVLHLAVKFGFNLSFLVNARDYLDHIWIIVLLKI